MPINIFRFTGGKSHAKDDENGGITCISFEGQTNVPRHPVIVEVIDETKNPKESKERNFRTPNPFRPLLHSRAFSLPVVFPLPRSDPQHTPPVPHRSSQPHPNPVPVIPHRLTTPDSRLKEFNILNEQALIKAKEEFLTKWTTPPHSNSRLENFKLIKTLGVGSFGRVMLVKHKKTKMYYAMKILKKQAVVQTKQVEHTLAEKRIIQSIRHPFIVNLKCHFKDNSNLYMVMEYIPGDLFYHLRKLRRFEESHSKFYAAQILLVLEYLHNLDIIYRDMKPENILLDRDGYLKLADFGLAKVTKQRSYTLVGTPEYMAPEIFLHKGYNKSVDWWALGILIFEMTAGFAPFHYDGKDMKMLNKIITERLEFPPHFSAELKDLLKKLLQIDITRRYGNLHKGANDVRNHKWFRTIDWLNLAQKKIKPPLIPKLRSPEDTRFFEPVEEDKTLLRKCSAPLFENEFRSF